jgi:hypothetical protein
MYLRELFSEPEVDEAVKTIWSRSGGKQVRKYRCTSGQRKGRIVAKAATCNAPLNQKAKITLSKTKRRKGSALNIKTAKTKRSNPASKRLKRINKPSKVRFSNRRRIK